MSIDLEGEIVSLNVGGATHHISYNAVCRFKDLKLCRLVDQKRTSSNEQVHIFVDRSVKYFKLILELHRMGTLHLMQGICWHRLKEELEFWELDARACLAPCCAQRVMEQEEREHLASYLEKQLDDCCSPGILHTNTDNKNDIKNRCISCCQNIWVFLEDPTSSIPAKVSEYNTSTYRLKNCKCNIQFKSMSSSTDNERLYSTSKRQ